MQTEERIRMLLKQGEIIEIENELKKMQSWSSDMVVLNCLIQIFRLEVANEVPYTIFDYSLDLDRLVEHFVKTKLYLRRLEFDLPMDKQKEACQYWLDTKVSDEALGWMLLTNIFRQKKVCGQLIELFRDMIGEHSSHIQYFEQVNAQLGG